MTWIFRRESSCHEPACRIRVVEYAAAPMIAFRLFLENGLVNLAVIVGFLIFCIGLIPMVLWLGTARPKAESRPVANATGAGSPNPQQ